MTTPLEFNVFQQDAIYIMRAYDMLPLHDKASIQPKSHIFEPLHIKRFGQPSALARVFKINDEWLVKINRFPRGSSQSTALINNFAISRTLQGVVREIEVLKRFVVVPDHLISFQDGNLDIYVRFEKLIKNGKEMSKYLTELKEDFIKNENAFIEAFKVLICVIYLLLDKVAFNHNDLHLNNVMVIKEGSKYIPKIIDFDLASSSMISPKYIHPGILKAAQLMDVDGCQRPLWISQQKDHSALIDNRMYPSYSIDVAMFFDPILYEHKCKKLSLSSGMVKFLQDLKGMNYDVRQIVTYDPKESSCHIPER